MEDSAERESTSIIADAVAENVVNERCVVSQYRTTQKQLDTMLSHLETCTIDRIPIEWVIDIADETNGWFYGTAYHYNDLNQTLHVMVPDKLNPSFDGDIALDHRTVHLVECVDGKTEALFNKVVRDSVMKVRWEVDWFEEGTGKEPQVVGVPDGPVGRWIPSMARYYIRIANQLLVEDEDFGQDARGFVMLTADLNVKMKRCLKGKGTEDFIRLVKEGLVQSAPHAIENSTERGLTRNGSGSARNVGAGFGPVRKIADMSRGLRECLSDLLDERDKLLSQKEKFSKAFNSFVLDGDLDAGLKLMHHSERTSKKSPRKDGDASPRRRDSIDSQQEKLDVAAEEAWYVCQKIEKESLRLLKSDAASDEVEYLRKMQRKMQQEIDDRDKELEYLRQKL